MNSTLSNPESELQAARDVWCGLTYVDRNGTHWGAASTLTVAAYAKTVLLKLEV